jgi:hypothetical protein
MTTSVSQVRSRKTLRYAVGLGAVACILGAMCLGLTNGVIKVRRTAHSMQYS